MKAVIALLVLVSGVFVAQGALARGHCRGLQQDSCQQNYAKAEAYKYLLEVESSASSARSALNVVTQLSEQKRIPLEYVVGNYVYLMDQMGGRIYSNVAQKYIVDLAGHVGRRDKLVHVVDAYVEILQSNGGSPSNALTTLNIVMKGVANESYFLRDGVNVYVDLLNLFGGRIYTYVADQVFTEFFVVRSEYSPRELMGSLTDVYDATKNITKALSAFKLVLRGAEKCGSLVEATDDYVSLLAALGGPIYAAVAEREYEQLFGL